MSIRDKIRSATLGNKTQFNSKIVKYNGVEIEVRQLTLKEKTDYYSNCLDEKTQLPNPLKLQVLGIILSCYVPNTNEKVFEDSDFDVLSNDVAGGYTDELFLAFNELSNLNLDEAKKNSN